jgi:CheY-like chemotaxis protein
VDTLIEHPRTAYRIAVEDTGPGIAQDRLEAIFQAFQQADSSTSREYGGTGLGLSISRSLCNLLGYHITVASEVGRGSTFTINLNPRLSRSDEEGGAAEEASRERSDRRQGVMEGGDAGDGDQGAPSILPGGALSQPLIRPRVLVVDAESESGSAVSQALLAMGCEVFTADGCEEGGHRARGLRPDLVILTVPQDRQAAWECLGGFHDGDQSPTVPLILVDHTSSSGSARSYGALGVLRDGTEDGAFSRAVAQALESGGAPGESVLLMDPDLEGRDRIASLLRAMGLRVVATASGPAAVRQATVERPGLAVMRETEPGVADELRALRGLADLQVVALTGREAKGELLGPDAQELMAKVHQALGGA